MQRTEWARERDQSPRAESWPVSEGGCCCPASDWRRCPSICSGGVRTGGRLLTDTGTNRSRRRSSTTSSSSPARPTFAGAAIAVQVAGRTLEAGLRLQRDDQMPWGRVGAPRDSRRGCLLHRSVRFGPGRCQLTSGIDRFLGAGRLQSVNAVGGDRQRYEVDLTALEHVAAGDHRRFCRLDHGADGIRPAIANRPRPGLVGDARHSITANSSASDGRG